MSASPGWLRSVGLSPAGYAHVVIVYLPNRNRHGHEFDVEPWESEALRLQGLLFRGATSYPSRGSYRTCDERGRIAEQGLVVESTRMIVSFVKEREFTLKSIRQIRNFLRRFKEKTDQEAAALVIDGEMYYL